MRVGNLVFLSGAIGTPPTGELRVVQGGAGPETRATMDNIGRILEAAGLGFEDLVKCTVFLADYAAMNEVYVTYFEGMEPPARSTMAGSGRLGQRWKSSVSREGSSGDASDGKAAARPPTRRRMLCGADGHCVAGLRGR